MIPNKEIEFLKAIGEVTEYTGSKLNYDDVATIINLVGIRTNDGNEYTGGRGTSHYLSRAASQCSDCGDEDGCELIRDITGMSDEDGDDDDEE